MANTDKNIVITPNKGSTSDPVIAFSGANATVSAQTISLRVYPDNSGTLSFEGSAGQLFSVTNSLTGSIFSVNDISGIPSIEVNSDGRVLLAQYSGNVGIGTASPASTFHVVGNVRIANTSVNSCVIFPDGTFMRSSARLGLDAYCSLTAGNGLSSSTGLYNVAIGCNALTNNTTGCNNFASGFNALQANTTGCNNIAMGNGALQCNTTGANNIALGCFAQNLNTTGAKNFAVGTYALAKNSTGCNNIAQGYGALCSTTIGNDNIGISANALCANTTGSCNIAIGVGALAVNTIGTYNVAIGPYSLASNITGIMNIGLGTNTLQANTTGAYNIAVGVNSLINSTIGIHNIAQGYRSQFCNTTGSNNISIGVCSLSINTTGTCNISIGTCSLCAATPSNLNIAIGFGAGNAITTGVNNTVIGNLPAAAACVCTLLLGAGTCERIKVDNTGLYVNGSLFTGAPFSVKTTNYTAVSGDKLLCDTGSGSFTVTLPAAPALGDTILIYDKANFTTNPLTIGRNGLTIEGLADDFSLDIGHTRNELVYDGSTWHIYVSIGPRGLPGSNIAPETAAYSIALG